MFELELVSIMSRPSRTKTKLLSIPQKFNRYLKDIIGNNRNKIFFRFWFWIIQSTWRILDIDWFAMSLKLLNFHIFIVSLACWFEKKTLLYNTLPNMYWSTLWSFVMIIVWCFSQFECEPTEDELNLFKTSTSSSTKKKRNCVFLLKKNWKHMQWIGNKRKHIWNGNTLNQTRKKRIF